MSDSPGGEESDETMTLYTEDTDLDDDTQQGACGEVDGAP